MKIYITLKRKENEIIFKKIEISLMKHDSNIPFQAFSRCLKYSEMLLSTLRCISKDIDLLQKDDLNEFLNENSFKNPRHLKNLFSTVLL